MPSEKVLGKRKRKPVQKAEGDTDGPAIEDAQEIFRRHFEAQFAPIQDEYDAAAGKSSGKRQNANAGLEAEDDGEGGVEDMRSDSESDDEDDEWGGVSEDDEDSQDEDEDTESGSDAEANEVQVVDYSRPLPSTSTLAAEGVTMTKREMRAFLSSRPPDATDPATGSKPERQPGGGGGGGEDDDPHNEDSKTLLANDLALQRLISESHILAASNPFNDIGRGSRGGALAAAEEAGAGAATTTKAASFAEGRTRRLTTDLRLQKLGSKGSIFAQQKMPMGMRKGISAAREAKEDRRRREARENGIILETRSSGKGKAGGGGRRAKGGRGGVAVDMPGMGRFKDGELRLSKHEVRAVEMEGMRFDNGGKRRRRRR